MLIYNTTFQVDEDVHDNFLIWIKKTISRSTETRCIEGTAYLPDIEPSGRRKCLFFAMGSRK